EGRAAEPYGTVARLPSERGAGSLNGRGLNVEAVAFWSRDREFAGQDLAARAFGREIGKPVVLAAGSECVCQAETTIRFRCGMLMSKLRKIAPNDDEVQLRFVNSFECSH